MIKLNKHKSLLKKIAVGAVVLAVPTTYTLISTNDLHDKLNESNKVVQVQQELIDKQSKLIKKNNETIKSVSNQQLKQDQVNKIVDEKVKESENRLRRLIQNEIKSITLERELKIKQQKKRLKLKRNAEVKKKVQSKPVKKSVSVASASGYIKEFDGIITMYTANVESTGKSPNHPAYGITASGEKVQEGVTVAAGKQIPMFSKIEIEGLGTFTVTDRGGAITGNHIDVYTDSLDKAIKFGRQHRKVRIISYPNK